MDGCVVGSWRWGDCGLDKDAQFQYLPVSDAVNPKSELLRTLLREAMNWCLDYFTVDVRQEIFPFVLSPPYNQLYVNVVEKSFESTKP